MRFLTLDEYGKPLERGDDVMIIEKCGSVTGWVSTPRHWDGEPAENQTVVETVSGNVYFVEPENLRVVVQPHRYHETAKFKAEQSPKVKGTYLNTVYHNEGVSGVVSRLTKIDKEIDRLNYLDTMHDEYTDGDTLGYTDGSWGIYRERLLAVCRHLSLDMKAEAPIHQLERSIGRMTSRNHAIVTVLN